MKEDAEIFVDNGADGLVLGMLHTVFENHYKKSHFTTLRAKRASLISILERKINFTIFGAKIRKKVQN